jgi:hypothetical protein
METKDSSTTQIWDVAVSRPRFWVSTGHSEIYSCVSYLKKIGGGGERRNLEPMASDAGRRGSWE